MTDLQERNPEFIRAEQFVRFTDVSVFLTGKAGTGKTTFLRHIIEVSDKNIVVAAPTGVAAMNAGGVTLHSLFQLPFGVFIPVVGMPPTNPRCDWRNPRTFFQKMRMSKAKRDLLKKMELLIIDEVSMVRVDMLDAIDFVLRSVRKRKNEAFGGVQLLLVGDLRQLAPVARDEEWEVLRNYYDSPYFFDAHVFKKMNWARIELQKVYRQSDEKFVGLLNRLRNNQMSQEDFELLDRKYIPDFVAPIDDSYITLCSHNYKADQINNSALNALPGRVYTFKASVKDDFPEYMYPADLELKLKIGAQVMFIRNDVGENRQFYNGKIGYLHEVLEDSFVIEFPDENRRVGVSKQVWENKRYIVDSQTNEITEEELGSFSQYPLRLSWAVTIHKSQGLTFERAIIDAGDSFAPGQVYVALSRLTSLDGLILRSKIPPARITTDASVTSFLDYFPDENTLNQLFESSKDLYLRKIFVSAFALDELQFDWKMLIQDIPSKKMKNKEKMLEQGLVIQKTIDEVAEISRKFLVFLNERWPVGHLPSGYVMKRSQDAIDFFSEAIANKILQPMSHMIGEASTKSSRTDIFDIFNLFEEKAFRMEKLQRILIALSETSNIEDVLVDNSTERPVYTLMDDILKDSSKSKSSETNSSANDSDSIQKTKKPNPVKGETYNITFNMLMSGMGVAEIAVERNLAPSTIEGHISRLVLDGRVEKHLLIDDETETLVLQAIENIEEPSMQKLREALSDRVSYAQIRYVLSVWEEQNSTTTVSTQNA